MTKDLQVKIGHKNNNMQELVDSKVPWCQEEYPLIMMEWGDTQQL